MSTSAVSPLRGQLVLAFSVAFTGLTYAMLVMGFAFWVNPWKAEFHLLQSQVMVAYTAGALMITAATPLVGRLLDWISVRAAVVSGALLMAAGLALAAVATSFWQVLVIYATALPAAAALAGMLPAQTILVRLYPTRAGLVSGCVTMSMALGGVVMAVLTPPMLAFGGWRGAFFIVAGVMALAIAPIAWFLLDLPIGASARRLAAAAAAGASVEAAEEPKKPVGAFATPKFWILVVAGLFAIIPLSALPPHLVAIATDRGYSVAAGGGIVSIFSIACAVGNLVVGWLVDRLEGRIVYFGISAIIIASMVFFAVQPPLVGLFVGAATLGFAGGGLLPWSAALVNRYFGSVAFARVFGLLNLFFLPATVFAVIVGSLHDMTGDYRSSFVLFALIPIPGLLAASLLKPKAVAAVPA